MSFKALCVAGFLSSAICFSLIGWYYSNKKERVIVSEMAELCGVESADARLESILEAMRDGRCMNR